MYMKAAAPPTCLPDAIASFHHAQWYLTSAGACRNGPRSSSESYAA